MEMLQSGALLYTNKVQVYNLHFVHRSKYRYTGVNISSAVRVTFWLRTW